MRRRKKPPPPVPDGLREPWPDIDAWREARLAWERDHGWPSDPVEVLRQAAEAKRRRVGRPERNGETKA